MEPSVAARCASWRLSNAGGSETAWRPVTRPYGRCRHLLFGCMQSGGAHLMRTQRSRWAQPMRIHEKEPPGLKDEEHGSCGAVRGQGAHLMRTSESSFLFPTRRGRTAPARARDAIKARRRYTLTTGSVADRHPRVRIRCAPQTTAKRPSPQAFDEIEICHFFCQARVAKILRRTF